ncbi:hypothetical protein IJJ08_00710 [bacterium]|nr:hypothetical protein [bacterium]
MSGPVIEHLPEDAKGMAERRAVLAELRLMLSDSTGNRLEDIREDSQLYGDLNLTEYDLKRLTHELAIKYELDGESLYESAMENDEGQTVSDLLELVLEEKDLG